MKGFSSKTHISESRCDIGPEIYCLQARPCIFQPGNFTGWDSEGVSLYETKPIAATFDKCYHRCAVTEIKF